MPLLHVVADWTHSGISRRVHPDQVQAQIHTGKGRWMLVMCLGQHYVPVCKYSLFVPLDGCILQLDGCSMHPDGCILPPDRCIIIFSHCIWMVMYCHRMGVQCNWTDTFGHRTDVLLFLPVSPSLMSFPVRQIDGVDNDGNVTTVTHCLIPDSVTLV